MKKTIVNNQQKKIDNKMKSKSFIFFLLLTLVSFLSCDPPVPRPERRPFCIAEPQIPTWVIGGYIVLETNCDSISSISYVTEIEEHKTYIPDGLGGEWVLVTAQDTVVSQRQYRTTFYYKKYKGTQFVKVTEFFTTELCSSRLDAAVKGDR